MHETDQDLINRGHMDPGPASRPTSARINQLREPHPYQGNIDKVNALLIEGEPLSVTHHPHNRKSVGRIIVVWHSEFQNVWRNGSPQNGYIVEETLTTERADELEDQWAETIDQARVETKRNELLNKEPTRG